ncbi:hypothetical protein BD410DRAFT_720326 [Rickenella mellea]|uniref:RING-type domain-containing protein n=1 Tax=Rickenella mellea TaxID=50990 RepID=A0A4Y7Q9A8_9AGAM|nr:hypothetical protein BD410DRAFT_720326 [Rickenella mellea]
MSVDDVHVGPYSCSTEDDALIELICHLSLNDLNGLNKGKRRADAPLSDIDLAIQLSLEEANSALSDLRDYKLARSIDVALDVDQDVLDEWNRSEIQAQQDRAMALRLSGVTPNPHLRPLAPTMPSTSLGSTSRRTKEQEIRSSTPDDQPETEEVRTMPSKTSSVLQRSSVMSSRKSLPARQCAICLETTTGTTYRAPCGDYYDIECLVQTIDMATRDDSLLPLRCCRQEIPVNQVRLYVPSRMWSIFEKRLKEFNTADRLYCSNKACNGFLGERTTYSSSVGCGSCGISTCSRCTTLAHAIGAPCDPEAADAGVQQVIALGQEAGWQRCPQCRQMVELAHGCYHMTCRCRAEFCYLCAARWKNCRCEQWDEGRLIAAAERQVNNRLVGEAPQPPVVRERLVRDVAEHLRDNHECAHRSWNYRSGGGQCELCFFNLPLYLLQCRGCTMLACVRCRRNRI